MKNVFFALLLLVPAGCGSVPTNSVTVQCLPLKKWSDADQDQLKKEYDALSQGAKMRLAFEDYIAMRDADRACTDRGADRSRRE